MAKGKLQPASSTEYKLEEYKEDRKKNELGQEVLLWEDEIRDNNTYIKQEVRDLIASNPELTEEEKLIVQRLSMKSFHILPRSTFWEDWKVWVCNNHLILAFFMSHPLHPFGTRERVMNLVASLAFGLAATSGVTLWYINHERDIEEPIVSIWGLKVSHAMVVCSAFFGGFCNVLFDFLIWFLQVCPPCQPGSPLEHSLSDTTKFFWLWMGSNTAFIVTAISICMAIHVIFVRAALNDENEGGNLSTSLDDYSFVGTYVLEVIATQVIMFPIVAFTLFSGVLGCFTLPGIGGRPSQVKRVEKRMRQQRLRESGPVEI